VLTFDLDFGDILAAAGTGAPSVIIFRLRNQTPVAVNPRLFRVISDCESELGNGKWRHHHRRGRGLSGPAIADSTLKGD
jgi:predicted nuclease of predicted toxin-antitoxin system